MKSDRRKVLLIDDDPFYLKVLADAFLDNGFTVHTASDGQMGVEAFVKNSPDVVITDLIMPQMGGVSTCLEIRRLSAPAEPIIILLTQMFQGAPHEHEAAEMGSRIHIPKSTKPLDIVIIVEQLLDREKYGQIGG